MAKTLDYLAEIQSGGQIKSAHISQSIEAFTGASDYDITISGSLTISGALDVTDTFSASYAHVSNTAVSASYALSASYEINYETSSSYSEVATSASQAISSSYSSVSTTSSFALSVPTASYALTASYISGSGGGTPGGSDTQVQFNDGGAFGGDANFTWNKTTNVLSIKSNISSPAIQLSSVIPSTTAGVSLGELAFYNSVAGTDLGAVVLRADGNILDGNSPTRLELMTTPSGTETPTVKMTIKESGRVGIGAADPSNGFLEVNGNVSGTSIYASANIVAYSDARSKTNVETIENAVDKVSAIRGVTYNKVEDPHGIRYMGVIAQELQDVLPEVVAEGEDGNLAVAYGNITGVLIEAIKELKAEIEELKANR